MLPGFPESDAFYFDKYKPFFSIEEGKARIGYMSEQKFDGSFGI